MDILKNYRGGGAGGGLQHPGPPPPRLIRLDECYLVGYRKQYSTVTVDGFIMFIPPIFWDTENKLNQPSGYTEQKKTKT